LETVAKVILSVQTGSPDGYNRSYITINGQTPGPLIEANEGDTLVSTYRNSFLQLVSDSSLELKAD